MSAALAIVLAAAGLIVLTLLYLRRRRSEGRATWAVTIVAALIGAGLCYVPHPRVADVQVFGAPFPIAFNVFTTQLTVLQPLGVFAVASWILNTLLVRELLLAVTRRDGPPGSEAAGAPVASPGDGHEPLATSPSRPPSRRRRSPH
jgi:hypothetical protein